MSRGQPDYGALAPKEVAVSISDMGEIAARLGSIVIYDKRGDVVTFDNFEDSILKWSDSFGSASCYARLDTTNAASGSQSLKLHTDAVATNYAALVKAFSVLASKRIGIEWGFSFLEGNRYLELIIQQYDRKTHSQGGIRINPNLKKIYLQKTDTEWTELVDTGTMAFAQYMFAKIKLVVDFATGKYVRLLFSLNEYDISEYDLFSEESTLAPIMYCNLRLHNIGEAEGDVWLDDFILTQAEP